MRLIPKIIVLAVIMITASSCVSRRVGVVKDEAAVDEAPALPFTAVRASPSGTCAVRIDGTLWCWGNNSHQSLGLGGSLRVLHPMQVGPLDEVQDVAPGAGHTCALKRDGALFCVGRNNRGQLGNEGESVGTFVKVSGSYRSVAVSTGATCAVRDDRTLWCWGLADLGPERKVDDATPQQVDEAADWSAVKTVGTGVKEGGTAATFGIATKAADKDLDCELRSGALFCWGELVPTYGGPDATKAKARQVSQRDDYVGVAVGDEHACALRRDGRIDCYGANTYGQLGVDKPGSDLSFSDGMVNVRSP